MYSSPQSFFDDESPPSSPVDTAGLPTFHLSPAPPGHKAARSDHPIRRWNSLARPKPHTLPFSYEYIFEDGRLAGLAEYHPDQDFLHYSSSRGSSASNSRSPSRRTSAEHSTRSSTDTRYSNESEHSCTQSSPWTSDKIKRALSFSRVRGQRRGSDRGRDNGLGLITRSIAVEPTTPTKRDGPILPYESPRAAPPPPTRLAKSSEAPKFSSAWTTPSFESPRVAPQPPTKSMARLDKPNLEAVTAHEVKLNRKKSMRDEVRSNRLEIPRTKESSIFGEENGNSFGEPKHAASSTEQTPTESMISGALQLKKVGAGQPLRRKRSKFIEHLDDKTVKMGVEAEENGVQVIPLIPSPNPMLPTSTIQPEQQQGGSRPPFQRSRTVARRDPNDTQPEWPSTFNAESTEPVSSPPARSVQKFAVGPRTQPLPNDIMRKRSASNVKTSGSAQPASTSLTRASSLSSRPKTRWTDVCVAEVKPTLMSPVVACGHARMVSCGHARMVSC